MLARVTQELVSQGVHRLVVAGGETAGAVVSALNIRALQIGPEIAPGVPWTIAVSSSTEESIHPPLSLALKSGNFGGTDFFTNALGL